MTLQHAIQLHLLPLSPPGRECGKNLHFLGEQQTSRVFARASMAKFPDASGGGCHRTQEPIQQFVRIAGWPTFEFGTSFANDKVQGRSHELDMRRTVSGRTARERRENPAILDGRDCRNGLDRVVVSHPNRFQYGHFRVPPNALCTRPTNTGLSQLRKVPRCKPQIAFTG